MHLLLCSATELEIQPTIDFIRDNRVSGIEVLITGVGLTAATYGLTRAVITKRPRFILQAGLAGCIDRNLPLTKMVLVGTETLGDLGVEESGNFRSIFDLGLQDKNAAPFVQGRLPNKQELLQLAGLPIVDGVTVHEISTNTERINYYRDQLGAQVESMEGAALHYVALLEQIPFLQLRCLSNFAGERDKNKWVMAAAINMLNQDLQRIILKFSKP